MGQTLDRLDPPIRARSKHLAAALIEATAEILACLNKRRLRVNPRVIKAKMSKWPLKRAGHRNTPQPQAPPAGTITITGPSRTGYKKRRPRTQPPEQNPDLGD